jgi:D-serine deaminase-like pyridoxal phosphate-dependent protein
VLADLDVGQRRAGARGATAVLEIVEAILAEGDGVRYGGVQAYEGHLQLIEPDEQRTGHAMALRRLTDAVESLATAGHPPPVVTTAGTGTAALALGAAGRPITEIQPGSYALMDATYARTAGGADFAQAAHVHTTVRSRLDAESVIVDAGLKAVSTDAGPARVADREATWRPAGDEHGLVTGDVADLRPGDTLRLVPSHTDTTVRLHRALWLDGAVSLPVF